MNAHRLARLGVAMLLMTGATALAGCSFDPFKNDVPPDPEVNLVRAGRMLSQAETKMAVPVGAATPSGYAVESENSLQPKKFKKHTVRPARCGALYSGMDLDYIKARAKTYQTYVAPDKTSLGVGVSSRARSNAGVANALALMAGCQKFVITEGKNKVRITSAPLDLPSMGDASVAIRYTIHAAGARAHYDAVRIRAGHNTVLVDAFSTTDVLPDPAVMERAADAVLVSLSR